jgi:hypothetical protein
MTKNYLWTDNPTEANVAVYDPDILNECLMHLKYSNTKLTPFTINSASTDSSANPNLLTYSGTSLSFNCGTSSIPIMTSNAQSGWTLSASHSINTASNDLYKSFNNDSTNYCALQHTPSTTEPAYVSIEYTSAFSCDYLYLKFNSVLNSGSMKNFSIKDGSGNEIFSYQNFGSLMDKDEFLIPVFGFNSSKIVISTTENVNNVSYVNFPSIIKILDRSQVVSLTTAQGAKALLCNINNLSLNTDGTYNIYLGTDGSVSAYATSLTYGKVLPSTPTVDQVHYLTCTEPVKALKYNGSLWLEYDKVPVGKVVVASGTISSVTTFPYGQNGYVVNSNTNTIKKFNNQKISQIGIYTVNNIDYPLLCQFGSFGTAGNNSGTAVYASAFPNATIYVNPNVLSSGGYGADVYWTGFTNAQFNWAKDAGSTGSLNGTAYYMAIGY